MRGLPFFERIVAIAKEYGIYVVHDLAYADIVFDGYKAPSIMQVPGAKDVAVEFFTLSKSYNMAGWRVGFMVGNPDLVGALARIKSYHDYGTFTPIQVAAIVALEGPQECVEQVSHDLSEAPRRLCSGLHEVGLECADNPKPACTFGRRSRSLRGDGFARVCQEAAGGRQSGGVSGNRLWPVRRRPRALLSDRERGAHTAGIRGLRDMFRKDGLLKLVATG